MKVTGHDLDEQIFHDGEKHTAQAADVLLYVHESFTVTEDHIEDEWEDEGSGEV